MSKQENNGCVQINQSRSIKSGTDVAQVRKRGLSSLPQIYCISETLPIYCISRLNSHRRTWLLLRKEQYLFIRLDAKIQKAIVVFGLIQLHMLDFKKSVSGAVLLVGGGVVLSGWMRYKTRHDWESYSFTRFMPCLSPPEWDLKWLTIKCIKQMQVVFLKIK